MKPILETKMTKEELDLFVNAGFDAFCNKNQFCTECCFLNKRNTCDLAKFRTGNYRWEIEVMNKNE